MGSGNYPEIRNAIISLVAMAEEGAFANEYL